MTTENLTAVLADLRVRRAQIDAAITALESLAGDPALAGMANGAPTNGARPVPRVAKPATPKSTPKPKPAPASPSGRPRAARGELAGLVLRALEDLGNGSGTAQIAAAVKALGYETAAKDECWVQMVYQVLAKHPRVRWLGRGHGWGLAAEQARAS